MPDISRWSSCPVIRTVYSISFKAPLHSLELVAGSSSRVGSSMALRAEIEYSDVASSKVRISSTLTPSLPDAVSLPD